MTTAVTMLRQSLDERSGNVECRHEADMVGRVQHAAVGFCNGLSVDLGGG